MSDIKPPNKNEHVVIALFPDQISAEIGVNSLKDWDEASKEIKLGAVGILSKENGKVKTHLSNKMVVGTGLGVAVGVIAGVLSGGLTLIGGMLVGALAGGSVGAFMKQSLDLTPEEIDALGPALDAGKVAVVVLCDEYEIGPTQTQLVEFGGTVRTYAVPAEALAEAAAAGVGADLSTPEATSDLAASEVTSELAATEATGDFAASEITSELSATEATSELPAGEA
jgi:uncharacterized membrane protein